jgi:hypothetical protein
MMAIIHRCSVDPADAAAFAAIPELKFPNLPGFGVENIKSGSGSATTSRRLRARGACL